MKFLDSIKDKISEWGSSKIAEIISAISKDLLGLSDALFPIFIIVAIVGVIITMSGQRKLGTKISSLSFITYIVLRVVAMTYV